MFLIVCIWATLLASLPITTYSQTIITEGDSVFAPKKDTAKCGYPCPRKAATFAILPGGGQLYNRKYWKLPIVYGALGTLSYLAISSGVNYKKYKIGYLTAIDSVAGNETFKDGVVYNSQRLFTEQEKFHNRRDIFMLVGVVVYMATIVDALVDAHLAYFDVSDNLSMQIKPNVQPYYNFGVNNSLAMKANVGLTVNINVHSKQRK
ncbi:MAG: hypothetical protein H7331_08060 [Bacteroidia bacterium]|nr:hypothetical protein [Bacteroidia bacterium]